jgi:hypothetical protein
MGQITNKDLSGDIVTWSMATAEVPVLEVRSALLSSFPACSEEREACKPLSHESAFSRAIAPLKKEGRLVEKVKKEGSRVLHQFTLEQNTGSAIHHQRETFVTLDTETGLVDGADKDIIDRVQDGMAQAQLVRKRQDITGLVQKFFRENADLLSINQQLGVAYFVPARFFPYADKVENFLKLVGGHLGRFPVPSGTERGDRSVSKAVGDGLDYLIDELDKTVSSVESAEDEGRTIRSDTLKSRLKEFELIQYKIESYHVYLGDTQRELLEKANKIGQRLQAQLTKGQEADD